MSDTRYDVAVVGAGPAGTTAAILLAQEKFKVALVDRDEFPRKRTSAGWLNARAAPILAKLEVPSKPFIERAFRKVTFHNGDFSKSGRPNFKDAPGFLIDRAEFDNALVKAAGGAGVKLLHQRPVRGLKLRESFIVVEADGGEPIEARLLVLAAGAGSPLIEAVGLERGFGSHAAWTAQIDTEVPASAAVSEPEVAVILGVDRRGSFAIICRSARRVSFALTWYGEREATLSTLAALSRTAHERSIIPVDLSASAAEAPIGRSPGAVALDRESHVAKHTLLIGDAGGFVSAASHEGIYPAMWSAEIAAQVLAAALKSPRSQDELMRFNSEWRMRMADYLRSPNTDVQFLLPLVFSNQPMADRMGAAFFSGENI